MEPKLDNPKKANFQRWKQGQRYQKQKSRRYQKQTGTAAEPSEGDPDGSSSSEVEEEEIEVIPGRNYEMPEEDEEEAAQQYDPQVLAKEGI